MAVATCLDRIVIFLISFAIVCGVLSVFETQYLKKINSSEFENHYNFTTTPTLYPSAAPSPRPTKKPTKRPTKRPTKKPTKRPTLYPSAAPSPRPTKNPTKRPTQRPTSNPTPNPTHEPTPRPICSITANPDIPALPEFSIIGNGYNIIFGNPLTTTGNYDPGIMNAVFSTDDYCEGNNNYMNGKLYKVSDGLDFTPGDVCMSDWEFTSVTGIRSYSSMLSQFVSASANFGPFSFSASENYQHIYDTTDKQENIVIMSTRKCVVYQVNIQEPNDYPYFSKNFAAEIMHNMPLFYDKTNQTNRDYWYAFFGTDTALGFGTHYISSMSGGAIVGQYSAISEHSYTLFDSSNFNLKASAGYSASQNAGASISAGYQTAAAHQYQSMIMNEKVNTYTIGTKLPPSGSADSWHSSLYKTPMNIALELAPMYELLSGYEVWQKQNWPVSEEVLNQKYNALYDATADYCHLFRNLNPDKQIFCDALPKDNPMPLPSVFGGIFCSDIASNCVNPYTNGFNCKPGYDANLLLTWYGTSWYYCLHSKFHKHGIYYDPNDFFGGFFVAQYHDSQFNKCVLPNAFTNNLCACPKGYTTNLFGSQAHPKGGPTGFYGQEYWCFNQKKFDKLESENEHAILGGFYQTGHIQVVNPFTKVLSCPDGFTNHLMANSYNCDTYDDTWKCTRYICLSNVYDVTN